MDRKKSLIDEFSDKAVAGELKALVESAAVIEGANAFYAHQAYLTDHVATGDAMCEWHVRGKEDVLMMSGAHAQALLSVSDMPLVEKFFQYPTKEFEQVRDGEIALGMIKQTTPMVVMMQKQAVLDLIDPAVHHENEMGLLIERIQGFMQDRELDHDAMHDLLDKLEEDHPVREIDPDSPQQG